MTSNIADVRERIIPAKFHADANVVRTRQCVGTSRASRRTHIEHLYMLCVCTIISIINVTSIPYLQSSFVTPHIFLKHDVNTCYEMKRQAKQKSLLFN